MEDVDMRYAVAADAIVVLHGLFIVFAALGGLLSIRDPRAAALHLPAAAWAAWIELSGGICPLTPVENRLRELAGESSYAGGFIEHYLLPVIYPPGLTPSIQWMLAVAVVLINVGIYTWVIRRRRR